MESRRNSKRIKKNSSNMFRNRVAVFLMLFCSCNIFAKAQVWAMILEGLISAAEEYSYQMDLDEQIEKEIKQAVGKLQSIEFERTELYKVGKIYDDKAKSSNDMEEELSDRVHSFFYFMNDVDMNNIANGCVVASSLRHQDSLKSTLEIVSLEHILNSQVLDSLRMYNEDRFVVELLGDIKRDRRIAYTLNGNPGALRIYLHSINSDLRKSPAHLSYWVTNKGIKHIPNIPKNIQQINPLELEFKGKNIYQNNELLGTIYGNKLDVHNINLLNLIPQPRSIYQYDNTTFYTDAVGRVMKVEQVISVSDKGKCEQKTRLKARHFAPQQAIVENPKAYHLGLTNYKAPECFVNTVFVTNSKENKKAIRTIKKEVRKAVNSVNRVRVMTVLNYEKGSKYCETLNVSVNGKDVATIVNKRI